ncbi:MAG: transporter substrate-binding domain-containing protein [Beijerinckiaceae bacterium]
MKAFLTSLAFAVLALLPSENSSAQNANAVPFFDLARKPEKPDLANLRAIRFLTDDDYPPFHFAGPDGQLTGFNVDLARAICVELKVACTIQARRWETLIPSLVEGRGDAIIASMANREAAREQVEFGLPYYRAPARFIARKEFPVSTMDQASLKDRTAGVIAQSSHAAFLKAFFPSLTQKTFPDQDEALKALEAKEIDAFFGDGISLSLWLNAPTGAACCQFLSGAYFESRFFGEGASIAFRKDGQQIRKAVDFAIFRLVENGTYQNLLLKYFPVRFY